jgi:hypothetical protein
MDKKLAITLFAILCLSFGGLAKATIIDFNSTNPAGTIQTGDNYDQVTLHDSAIVNMIGGEVGYLFSYNSSHINVSDGLLSYFLVASNSSIVEMSGGNVGVAELSDSSVMYLSGGRIDAYISIHSDAVLNIYGKDFLYTPGGVYGYGWLSGHWADNSSFNILFRHLPESFPPESSVILHIIPEPATILLFSIGTLLLRKSHINK